MTSWKMTVPALLSLMSLVTAVACSGEDDGEDDGDADDKVPEASCSSDTDCRSGEACTKNRCAVEVLTGDPAPLKEAKLIIEHNATDEDTGFQAFIDSEGWKRIDVAGPDGPVLTFEARGKLRELGLTELFFETVEPENARVPLADILGVLPAGDYTFQGPSVDGPLTLGTAHLSHDIPAGPELTSPKEGASVPLNNLVMRWEPVEETIHGQPIEIIRYQLIVEKDEEPDPRHIGKRQMSVYVSASVTSVSVPSEFLEPGTAYLWEVLAIAENGNQTLSSSEFTTE
jgi:hypothetical protein